MTMPAPTTTTLSTAATMPSAEPPGLSSLAPQTTATAPSLPPVTPAADALRATMFSSWYPLFRRLSPKATVIKPLDPEFIEWLEMDGCVLPEDAGEIVRSGSPASSSGFSSDGEEEGDDHSVTAQPSFPSLTARIRQIISSYDGAVFPKLNWSAPLDAAWMLPGSSLRCTVPADVYLLLKSSDFAAKDMEQCAELAASKEAARQEQLQERQGGGATQLSAENEPPSRLRQGLASLALASLSPHLPTSATTPSFTPPTSTAASTTESEPPDSLPTTPPPPLRSTTRTSAGVDSLDAIAATSMVRMGRSEGGQEEEEKPELELILKKWFDMPKSHEFRCFVRAGRLIAIAQRDPTYYEHLQPANVQLAFRQKMADFWKDQVRGRFALEDYTLDLYLTRDASRIFIIDFNAYGPLSRTDALLWDWDELEELAGQRLLAEAEEALVAEELGSSVAAGSRVVRTRTGGGGEGEELVEEEIVVRIPLEAVAGDAPSATASTTLTSAGSNREDRGPSTIAASSGLVGENGRQRSDSSVTLPAEPWPLLTSEAHLPPLRLIATRAEASQSMPTYSANMYPKEVVDFGEGQGIAEFAQRWHEELDRAARAGEEDEEDGAEQNGG